MCMGSDEGCQWYKENCQLLVQRTESVVLIKPDGISRLQNIPSVNTMMPILCILAKTEILYECPLLSFSNLLPPSYDFL